MHIFEKKKYFQKREEREDVASIPHTVGVLMQKSCKMFSHLQILILRHRLFSEMRDWKINDLYRKSQIRDLTETPPPEPCLGSPPPRPFCSLSFAVFIKPMMAYQFEVWGSIILSGNMIFTNELIHINCTISIHIAEIKDSLNLKSNCKIWTTLCMLRCWTSSVVNSSAASISLLVRDPSPLTSILMKADSISCTDLMFPFRNWGGREVLIFRENRITAYSGEIFQMKLC